MQAIERTFGILNAMAGQPERVGVSEIARRAELPKSTTSRILSSLEAIGIVERIGDNYGIGAALATLTHAATPVGSLRELARPSLVELADALGENASLVVDDGDQSLYIDTATPSELQVHVQDWTGERLPFHAAAGGLSLMSTWSTQRIAELCDLGLEAFTDLTVIDNAGLQRKLTQLGQDGVVWTIQEFSDDVAGIGAPIMGPEHEAVGAINVYGPTFRFPGERDPAEIAAIVKESCARIAARLVTD